MKIKYLYLILIMLFLTACRPGIMPTVSVKVGVPTATTETITGETNPLPYPEFDQDAVSYAYPTPMNDALMAYPTTGENAAVPQSSNGNAIPFKISKPVLSGSTQVSGTGLPGVPILLTNVTQMGDVIASTVIKDDGTFLFEITPITAGERLGILVGDLTKTGWTIEDFYEPGFNGDEPFNVPMVGFFWDTAMVTEK